MISLKSYLMEELMPKEMKIEGELAKSGERMTIDAGWMLVTTKGKKRFFKAKLRHVINAGKYRFAIFAVPK